MKPIYASKDISNDNSPPSPCCPIPNNIAKIYENITMRNNSLIKVNIKKYKPFPDLEILIMRYYPVGRNR
jgi:hypothetical protein